LFRPDSSGPQETHEIGPVSEPFYFGPDETVLLRDETILRPGRSNPERNAGHAAITDQRWGSIMWAIISSIYRAYCRARLAEMRRYRRFSHA
jgi:hypothetical protein